MSEALAIVQEQITAEYGIEAHDARKHAKGIIHALYAAGFEIVRVEAEPQHSQAQQPALQFVLRNIDDRLAALEQRLPEPDGR